MKYFKRYSSLLLAAVLSLSVFSLQVSAIKAPNGGDLLFNMDVIEYTSTGNSPGPVVGGVTKINPESLTKDTFYEVGDISYYPGEAQGVCCRLNVSSSTNSVLFEAGSSYNYSFNGIIYSNNASTFNVARVDWYYTYADGSNTGSYSVNSNSSVTLDGYFAESLRRTFTVTSSFTPEKDVTRIWCRVFFILNRGPNESGYCSGGMGYGNVDINIKKISETDGILSIIRNKLSNIIEDIASGFTNIGSLLGTVRDKLNTLMPTLLTPLEAIRDKLTTLTSTLLTPLETIRDKIGETVTNIINLPGKIWEGFQNALWGIIVPDWYQGTYSSQNNNLFWPTPEEMSDIVTAFDDLFGEVLGPLWNIPETVLMKYYNTFVIDMPTADDHIDVPEISFEIVGERLVFGPYRIPLVPKGLDSITGITKVLSAIICTFGFVAMVARKIHSILKR